MVILLVTADPLSSLLYRAWYDVSLLRQGLLAYRCPPWSPLDTLCQATILFVLCSASVFIGVPYLHKYIHIYDTYNVDELPCAAERLELATNGFTLVANSSLECAIVLTSWLLYILYSQGLETLSMLWLSLHYPSFVPRCHLRKRWKRWLMLEKTSHAPSDGGAQVQLQTKELRRSVLFATEI